MSKQTLRGFFLLAIVILLVSFSDKIAELGPLAQAVLTIAGFVVGGQLASGFSDRGDK